jgi:hypothetical protein
MRGSPRTTGRRGGGVAARGAGAAAGPDHTAIALREAIEWMLASIIPAKSGPSICAA